MNLSTTTTTRAAAVALLMALLVLGVAAPPVSAQTDSGPGGSFGLDAAATEDGGVTLGLNAQTDPAGEPAAGGTAMEAPTETTGGATIGTTVGTTEMVPATTEQPTVTPGPADAQYQYSSLADTGGVPPQRPLLWPLLFGGVVAATLTGLLLVNRRMWRPTNGKDDNVFFG